MKKRYGILTGMMSSLMVVCTYIVLALALCTLTGYAAEDDTQAQTTVLPIRENPVAARDGDFYVIREDGMLIRSTGDALQGRLDSGFAFNRPTEVMENAVAVYAHEEGAVVVVDRDGTLWGLDKYSRSGLTALYPESVEQDGPVKLLEDVSMAAVDYYHAVILKRDGTLWAAGWNDGPYFTQVMDHVIWADTTYYGGYAVTDDHELWMWGRSEDATEPEKLADGVVRVSASNTAVTEDGELLNWYYTEQGSESNHDFARVWTEPEAILSGVAVSGRGYVIMEDGSIWCGTAGWRNGMSESEAHYWDKYSVRTPFSYDWCNITDGGASLQQLSVKDAAYAAVGGNRMIVLDKEGVLWGIFDLNGTWNGPFSPFSPVRLMDGCYGAEEPAGDGMDNFTAVNQYRPGQFSDVKDGDWFQENVKAAYELGLMEGYTNGSFRPDGTITLGEAVTIAVRVRATYRGDSTELPSPATGPWYQPYVNYALATHVQKIYIPDYSQPATRAELASLLSGALPVDEFPRYNEGITFSDVQKGDYYAYYDYVMWMAEAGIMQGKGGGLFDPTAPVKRSEAAAMLSRCAWPELRLKLD